MFMPDAPKNKEPLRDDRWYLIKELDDKSGVYEERYYDINGNLVRLNNQRVYVGESVYMQYSVNANGVKDGRFEKYSSHGELVLSCSYKDGVLNGEYSEYQQGVLRKQGYYKNGKRVGLWLSYDKNSLPIRQTTYGDFSVISESLKHNGADEALEDQPIGQAPDYKPILGFNTGSTTDQTTNCHRIAHKAQQKGLSPEERSRT